MVMFLIASIRHRLLVIFVGIAVVALFAEPCAAQQGGFIEDLFRRVAESQLQREQSKRAEAERQANVPVPQPSESRDVQVPASIFPRGPLGPATPPAGRTIDRPIPPNPPQQPDRRPPVDPRNNLNPSQPNRTQPNANPNNSETITVRSREAAEFVENLARFNRSIDPLIADMKRNSANMPAVRPLLPVAYRVSADTRALLSRCNGLTAPQTLVEPYAELDTRWRQLSFGLRSLEGISNDCTSAIRECDKTCSLMAKQLGIQPQFDREGLRQVMLTAATYMQSLMDDLLLVQLPPAERDGLVRDVRLHRQQLLAETDDARDASYEEVVSRFTEFVGRWQRVSSRMLGIRDPHVQMRLDRIRQCGNDVYALVWMPPPSPAIDMRAQAARLQQAYSEVMEQLSLRAMVSLSAQDQLRVVESSRRLDDQCRQFSTLAQNNSSSDKLFSLASEIDRGWSGLRVQLASLTTVNRSSLDEMDRACGGLSQSLGRNAPIAGLDYENLLAAAASLEGSSEYLLADMQRYARYLQPTSYRDSVVKSTTELHEASKQLHFELSRRADLAAVQRTADAATHSFERLSLDLRDIEQHGLPGSRATVVRHAQQELTPLVARIAAALLDH